MIKVQILFLIATVTIACQNSQDNTGTNSSNESNNTVVINTDTIEKKVIEAENRDENENNAKIGVYGMTMNNTMFDSIVEKFSGNKPSNSIIHILQDKVYHGYEIEEGIDTLKWYGLIKKKGKFHIEKVKIKINKVFDEIEGGRTAKDIVVEGGNNTILLISGKQSLNEGEVTSLEIKSLFNPGDTMSFKLNDESFNIYAFGGERINDMVYPYLFLASSSYDNHDKKQIFFATRAIIETNFRFIWAGDLDNDDKLDLIMDLSDHYNVSRIALFLSSMAEEGEVFKLVAERINSGC